MKRFYLYMMLVVMLGACTSATEPTTPDEIFDAIDGMSNHANDPESEL